MSIDDSPIEGRPELPPEPHAEAVTFSLFEQAVKANSRRLLTIARAIAGARLAEDIVQQALANLFEHRARYDWREPRPLMRRAVVNEALRVLRQPRLATVADDHPSKSLAPDGGLIGDETVQKVRWAISQLPEHFRAALVLREFEDMTYTQIADILNASVPQIKTWLYRGRQKISVLLQQFVQSDVPLED